MKTIQLFVVLSFCLFFSCNLITKETSKNSMQQELQSSQQYITVLGVAQDAGFPQINCSKECCMAYHNGIEEKKLVSSLGLVDLEKKQKWLFDATPDISKQLYNLNKNQSHSSTVVDGVFLTHAHIGHYTGLMYFGREALGIKDLPVYTMPKMKTFLESNGPWSQLVNLKNIVLKPIENDSIVFLNSNLKVTPLLVPHRDEFSETVGYKIEGKNKKALFIPDIDKWESWEKNIIEELKNVDYAFLDATFFNDGELNRDMSQIPHPFITQTTTLFQNETLETKNKIYFIHFNHTNPALKKRHRLKDSIQNLGFNFAKQGDNFKL